MGKINFLLLTTLFVVIYSCGNNKNKSEVEQTDKKATEKVQQIILTVESGTNINLRIAVDANNAEVKVVCGEKEDVYTIESDFLDIDYSASSETIAIYGDITKLYFYSKIKNVDISQASALTYLECGNNELTGLDVSQNTALSYLDCRDNKLTELDLSKNLELTELYCGLNSIKNLDLSKNTALIRLSCQNNPITTLDLSKNIVLKEITVGNEELNSLDISKNKDLSSIYCHSFSSDCYKVILDALPDRTGLEKGTFMIFGDSIKDELEDIKNWNIVVDTYK